MTLQVAIVKNSDIKKAVQEAVEKIGLPQVKGKRVLIKPNCNSPDKFPGTTNPEVVVEIIKLCQKAGAREIIIGDKSSVFWRESTEKVMKAIGLWQAVEKTKAKILPFDKDEWLRVKPGKASHWKLGFKIPKVLTEAEVIVSVPVIHTHRITKISLSLKNSVGVIDGLSRKLMHVNPNIQKKIAEINLAYEVDLVVMDGTKAFISGGPDKGDLVEPNTIVASRSRVQADIASYKLLVEWGADLPLPPESHPQITRAIEIGIK
jgi:uncharacterized protein (DUF362 family)